MINALLCTTIILSFLNLISTLFLSNAMFRILGGETMQKQSGKESGSESPVKNLVDLKNHPTYDIRFRDE